MDTFGAFESRRIVEWATVGMRCSSRQGRVNVNVRCAWQELSGAYLVPGPLSLEHRRLVIEGAARRQLESHLKLLP